jgi:hypothetical protein
VRFIPRFSILLFLPILISTALSASERGGKEKQRGDRVQASNRGSGGRDIPPLVFVDAWALTSA